ncbi:Phosphotyrosyl phosphatase activator [Imleria badia]|nr:Phosphotyrosyl phosphatase activator [Imleria badia]
MTTQSTLRDPRQIPLSDLVDTVKSPEQKIRYDEDVAYWKHTTGYRDYQLFLRRLNESVVGYTVPRPSDSDAASGGYSQAITNLLTLLDTLDKWIDASPAPQPGTATPRFGNPIFRDYWGDRLIKESDDLLGTLLSPTYVPAIRFLKPYFLESFGSFRRLDYGTGHETAFSLFLCALTLLRVVQPHPSDERALVLHVFVRYLRLCWRLQDTYKLEPAGSHGVWGLDDYSFLPYLFGSGQLRDQTTIPVNAILGVKLAKGAHPIDSFDNLYFMSIARIDQVKYGPFFEHSSQLYSIATHVQSWAKVNKGLFEMYQAEVLGKRVVVQHLPLGGLIEWDR